MQLVICNCPHDVSETIRNAIIRKDLAASVKLIPKVKRSFNDENSISTIEETMLLIQTVEDRLEEVFKAIVQLHPSDNPAIISLFINGGSGEYVNWVENALSNKEEEKS